MKSRSKKITFKAKYIAFAVVLLISSCIFDSGPCDDCPAIASKLFSFKFVDTNQNCLFPCNTEIQQKINFELYSINQNGDKVNQDIRIGSSSLSTYLPIDQKDIFYLMVNEIEHLMIVDSEILETNCTNCVKGNILAIQYEGTSLCNSKTDCEGKVFNLIVKL